MTTSVFNPQHDSYMDAAAPTWNGGNVTLLRAEYSNIKGLHTRYEAIMEFDISSLIGKTLTTAQLELYINNASNETAIICQRMIRPTGYASGQWLEGNGSAGSGCTWNTYDGDAVTPHNWSRAGGGADTDANLGRQSTLVNLNATTYQVVIPTSDTTLLANLQYILDTQTPAGIAALCIRKITEGSVAGLRWDARGVGNNQPKLTITYPAGEIVAARQSGISTPGLGVGIL